MSLNIGPNPIRLHMQKSSMSVESSHDILPNSSAPPPCYVRIHISWMKNHKYCLKV